MAAQLRSVATELHPPVLDDLGLVPALEALASQVAALPVRLRFDRTAGYTPDDRPPPEVELAAYRIAQEATANAVRHSGGAEVTISGGIRPDSVTIEIADDGRGVTDREIEDALRAGHLGIASMRRRAEAVDGTLEVSGSRDAGSTVRFRWVR